LILVRLLTGLGLSTPRPVLRLTLRLFSLAGLVVLLARLLLGLGFGLRVACGGGPTRVLGRLANLLLCLPVRLLRFSGLLGLAAGLLFGDLRLGLLPLSRGDAGEGGPPRGFDGNEGQDDVDRLEWFLGGVGHGRARLRRACVGC